MIVSHFQIRNSPTFNRQTYYELLITNLEKDAYSFRLHFTTGVWQFHQRSYLSVNQPSSSSIIGLQPMGGDRYRSKNELGLSAGETARVRLYPFNVPAFEQSTDFIDAFGHVELTIPLVWSWGGGEKTSQGNAPVRVLLHAYTIDWIPGSGYDDPAPVTLSSGQAENEIKPDQEGQFVAGAFSHAELMSFLESSGDEIRGFVEDERLPLAGLLYLLDAGRARPERIALINRLLADVELPYRIEG